MDMLVVLAAFAVAAVTPFMSSPPPSAGFELSDEDPGDGLQDNEFPDRQP